MPSLSFLATPTRHRYSHDEYARLQFELSLLQEQEEHKPEFLYYPIEHPFPLNNDTTIEISENCMFVPIIVAAWWLWTKRKARKFAVKTGLLREQTTTGWKCKCNSNDRTVTNNSKNNCQCEPHHSRSCGHVDVHEDQDDIHTEFSSWDQIERQQNQYLHQHKDADQNDSQNNNIQQEDPSIHFVRWMKTNNVSQSSSQQAAILKETSKRTMEYFSKNKQNTINNNNSSCSGSDSGKNNQSLFPTSSDSQELHPHGNKKNSAYSGRDTQLERSDLNHQNELCTSAPLATAAAAAATGRKQFERGANMNADFSHSIQII